MDGKRCIAMLLAGGQGSRLRSLTKHLAKPAVPFGGKYRIIDFALSNCTHSGIDTIGVLTQYQPHLLNSYVGNGRAWDLDRKFGGVSVLPPYKGNEGGEWYTGTANAIYQNIHFINQSNCEYVLVLSGDHIYKMDYNRLIDFHIEKKALATIGVIQVPWHETNRYGIINVDADNKVVEFEEKPTDPKSNLASMGIYVFDRKLLEDYLIEDEQNPESSHDFGKDVIPKILAEQDQLYAYLYNGYWKDVGTVQSLWEAHMDLLEDEPLLDLFDPHWKIYTVNANHPPHYISPEANIHQSLVNEGCSIFGDVDHSVLSYGVQVGEGSVIRDSVIMPEVTIGRNVQINRAIVESGAVIGDGEQIGSEDEGAEITLVGGKQSTHLSDHPRLIEK